MRARALAGGLTLLVAFGSAACSSSSPAPQGGSDSGSSGPAPSVGVAAVTASPSKVFGTGPDNPFRRDITSAQEDPNSRYLMDNLRSQIAANSGAVPVNTRQFGSSFAVATAGTAKSTVKFDNCQGKPTTPPELYSGPAYFKDVPIPADAVPAAGTDAALTIWSPDTDQLWEFWIMKKANDSWSACWGGRIDKASTSHGVFPVPFGASASGLATVGTAVSIAEGQSGQIDHAMGLGLRNIAAEGFRPVRQPATRTDGKDTTPAAIPMGTRLRLDPAVNVDALDMTPLGKAIARAAQKYGFIVTESAGVVSIGAETGDIEKARSGQDPWSGALGGKAEYQQMDHFPWDKVSVIESP